MIQCQPVKGTTTVMATFTVALDGHGEPMALVGDFNGWDPVANPLTRHRGARRASVVLEPGRRYAFRYLAGEGDWFNDDDADDYESNGMGDENFVLDLTL